MMISPNAFRDRHENDSMEELKKVRDELIHCIWNYEEGNIPEERYLISPGPGVVYSCNKKYLREVLDLIELKEEIEDIESCYKNPEDIDQNWLYIVRHQDRPEGITKMQAARLIRWLNEHGHTYPEAFEAVAVVLGVEEEEK